MLPLRDMYQIQRHKNVKIKGQKNNILSKQNPKKTRVAIELKRQNKI